MNLSSKQERRRKPRLSRWLVAAYVVVLLFGAYGKGVWSAVDKHARAQTTMAVQAVSTGLPLAPVDLSAPKGVGALMLLLLLAASTLVSEDLTCIAAGVLAAQGRASFVLAACGCLLGIFVGDLLLFLCGRFLGRAALRRAPLRWFISPVAVERSSAWFNRKGSTVILLSRFLPGTRVPTYFAAGLLNTNGWTFSLYFLVAAAIWTPALVGLSMLLGAEAFKSSLMFGQSVLGKAVVSGIIIFIIVKLTLRLSSYRGRRLLLGRLRRIVRWEFWPVWAFYPPVVCYIIYLAVQHRSLTVFTCANPSIPGGGFIGESKSAILQGLSAAPEAREYVARAGLLPAALPTNARLKLARDFMTAHKLTLPIVLKPDAGQRGSGVAIIRTDEQLADYLTRTQTDTIIQEYVAGQEFGVFYYRYPEAERGYIFSITEKRFPAVNGDGHSTLERLILADERAVCMARTYFDLHRDELWAVPDADERVQLVELGTHCRGAVFFDGAWIKTTALVAAIDKLSRGFAGFYFGRFDIRTPSLADFKQGRNFKIVELNGVTSEATHIYDPQNDLATAYKTLFAQWRLAFAIGAQNRARGARATPLRGLLKLLLASVKQPAHQASAAQTMAGNITCPAPDITL
jgi:membrane protein DedA with SNARE-associated domain